MITPCDFSYKNRIFVIGLSYVQVPLHGADAIGGNVDYLWIYAYLGVTLSIYGSMIFSFVKSRLFRVLEWITDV